PKIHSPPSYLASMVLTSTDRRSSSGRCRCRYSRANSRWPRILPPLNSSSPPPTTSSYPATATALVPGTVPARTTAPLDSSAAPESWRSTNKIENQADREKGEGSAAAFLKRGRVAMWVKDKQDETAINELHIIGHTRTAFTKVPDETLHERE
ncbi:hypothetical protein Vretifemale_2703, partial [Volvox reticuliferus]